MDELTRLALDAKNDTDALKHLQVETLAIVTPIATRFSIRFNGNVQDDIVNDFIVDFDRFVQRFDSNIKSWASYIRYRFRYFCKDWARLKHNQPTGTYVSRGGKVRWKWEELSLVRELNGQPLRDDFASQIESHYRDHDQEARDFRRFTKAMGLSDRACSILFAKFVDGKTLKECGELAGLSPARTSQLVKDAMATIRYHLMDNPTGPFSRIGSGLTTEEPKESK